MRADRRIIHVLILLSVLFLALATYLLYFNMFSARTVAQSPYNKRQWLAESHVKRGSVFDTNGITLAQTVTDKSGNSARSYPFGALYSHIIGYHSQTYGNSQLEMKYDGPLMGQNNISPAFSGVTQGNDLTLTIDNALQQYAYSQLGSRNGAVIALDPKTGRILAMVSKPDFDPNEDKLDSNWETMVNDQNAPLLARATQGLYAPGSTYKIVTVSAAFEAGLTGQTFNDTGKFDIGSNIISNDDGKAHGNITVAQGFTVSSNFVFCSLGTQIGEGPTKSIAGRFGVDKTFDFDLPMSISTLPYKNMTSGDCALTAIGQGKLLVTPLQMAMVVSCVANGGAIMKPYLVDKVTAPDGATVSAASTQTLYSAESKDTADYIKSLMVDVVKSGTGTNAQIRGITVAGKTGTAENEKTVGGQSDKTHTWFVGFAPAEAPQIAVAVILEYNGGTGGEYAAPIARNVMSKYLGK